MIGCAGSGTRRTCPPRGEPPRRSRRPAAGNPRTRALKERMHARHGRLRVRRDSSLRHDRGDGLEAQVSRLGGGLGSRPRSELFPSTADRTSAFRSDRRTYLPVGTAPVRNASLAGCTVPLPTSMLRKHEREEVIGCGSRTTGSAGAHGAAVGPRSSSQPAPDGSRHSRRARKERIDAEGVLFAGESGRPRHGGRRRLEAAVSLYHRFHPEAPRVTGGLSVLRASYRGAAPA